MKKNILFILGLFLAQSHAECEAQDLEAFKEALAIKNAEIEIRDEKITNLEQKVKEYDATLGALLEGIEQIQDY